MHGIWEIYIFAGFCGTGTENHGKTEVPTGMVWMGTGNQDFHGKYLGGIGKSIFVRDLFWVGPRERYFHGNRNESRFP